MIRCLTLIGGPEDGQTIAVAGGFTANGLRFPYVECTTDADDKVRFRYARYRKTEPGRFVFAGWCQSPVIEPSEEWHALSHLSSTGEE